MQENTSETDYGDTNMSVDMLHNTKNLSTIRYVESYTSSPYILSIIFYTISVCGILFNMFTITIIRLHRPMHKQLINMFIVNQSIIDILASMLLIFTTKFQYNYFVAIQPGKFLDEMMCRLWYSQAPMWSLLLSSTYGIIALNFERCIAVVYPVWHKLNFTKRKVALLIAGTWLIGPCYYIPYALTTSWITSYGTCSIYSYYPTQILNYTSGTCCFIVAYVFPLVLLIYFYIAMILALQRKMPPTTVKEYTNEGLCLATKNADDKEFIDETNHLKVIEERTTKLETFDDCVDKYTNLKEAKPLPRESVKSRPSGSQIGFNIKSDVEIESKTKPVNKRLDDVILEGQEKRKKFSFDTSPRAAESAPAVFSYEIVSITTKNNGNEGKISTKKKTASKESTFTIRARGNIIKTLALVSIGFVLCWSGSEISFFLGQIHLVKTNFSGWFYNFTVVMVFLSCCINPVIYCIQYRQFQNGVRRVLFQTVVYQFRIGENKIGPIVRK